MNNTLSPDDYYTQRNNKINPSGACNVTSVIMALCQAGRYPDIVTAMKGSAFTQPEDALMNHIRSDRWREHAASLLGEQYRNYPEQVWATLVGATNEWIGKQVLSIDWNADVKKIGSYIDNGSGVVVGTKFTPDGHFVNIGDISDDVVLINDPWGDLNTGYRSEKGYGVAIPMDVFVKKAHRKTAKNGAPIFFIIVVTPITED